MAISSQPVKYPSNPNGYIFALVLFLYQVVVCLFYGFWFQYQPITTATIFYQGQLIIVAFLTILVLVGFGVLNAYITNASYSGMALTLLTFVLTLEHYFLIKAFWQKAGTSDPNSSKSFNTGSPVVGKISFVNYGQDRFYNAAGTGYEHEPQFYSHHSFVDAIACALANVVALASIVGRIKFFETFWLSLLGTFIYEVNNQIFWRLAIYDTGYGMRIFLFGGVMGLFASILLGRKETTVNHPRYISLYASRGFGLLGMLVIFSTFPNLVAAGIFRTSANKEIILYSAVLRMWLALIAGVLGCMSACALTYRKMHVFDVVFSAINGGIAYSSSADLNPNPAVPMTCGFVIAFVTSLYHNRQLRSLNKTGVATSLAALSRYIIPGFFSGVLSAILAAVNKGNDGQYLYIYGDNRSNIGQGGIQIAGVGIAIAIGIFAGLVLGVVLKLINKNPAYDQFDDAEIFRPDFPPSVHFVEWKET